MSLPVRPAVILALSLSVLWFVLPSVVRLGQGVEPELPVEAGLLVQSYGEAGTYGLHYRHEETVTIAVPVRNRGPLPMRIDKAGLGGSPLPLLVPVDDNLPIDIGPWGTADVELTMRFDNCRYYHERAVETWDRVLVEGSVLGRGFDEEVALAYPLALHAQVITNCPDRTLARGDDIRPR